MEGGPPCFPQTHRGSWYSGCQLCLLFPPVRDSHPLWWRVPTPSSTTGDTSAGPTTPACPKTRWFGLFPPRSPLRRESRLISFRRATEMFQFARCPPPSLYIQLGVSRHHSGRVAPFGISGLIAWMQLPANVSSVSTSFIGLTRQGIHLVLSFACALCCVVCSARSGCPHVTDDTTTQTRSRSSSSLVLSLLALAILK